MNKIEEKCQFDAPIEKVWAVLADTNSTPEWVHGVKASNALDEGEARKGFCWEEKISIDGQNADVQHQFTEWFLHQKAVIKTSLPMGGMMIKQFIFSKKDYGSELSITMEWDLGILEMLAGPAKVQAALEKSLRQTLEAWNTRVSAS